MLMKANSARERVAGAKKAPFAAPFKQEGRSFVTDEMREKLEKMKKIKEHF